jgi:hypothetical protein
MLARFEQDGVEIYIDNITSESFVTQRGYARLSGLNQSTISRRIKGDAFPEVKTAEVLTAGGIQGVALVPERLVCKWMLKDNPEVAEKLMQLGTRKFFHTLAGYNVESPKPEPIALPPADVRISNLISALKYIDIEVENPRFKQGIQDMVLDIAGIQQPSLKPSTWVGVAERAEQLGYPAYSVSKVRQGLGMAIAKVGLECVKENRLCNGTYRPINLFPVSDKLDDHIHKYMKHKGIALN